MQTIVVPSLSPDGFHVAKAAFYEYKIVCLYDAISQYESPTEVPKIAQVAPRLATPYADEPPAAHRGGRFPRRAAYM